MATQARAVLKIPARIVGGGNISVVLQNGIYTISDLKPSASGPKEINPQHGTTYTLQPSDNGKLVTFYNPNLITVTVPEGLVLGFYCDIAQLGEGRITVVGAGGTTVNALNDDPTFPGQWSVGHLYSYAPNAYVLSVVIGEAAISTIHNVNTAFVGTSSMVVTAPVGAALTTSAGVFDSAGRLVRTLWSAEVGNPDRNDPLAAWDGTLENGSVAPTGTYSARVIAHNCTYTWEGVVGNTSPDHTTMHYWNEPAPLVDMEIDPKGRMWYTSQYGERQPTFGYSRTSDVTTMRYGVQPDFRAAYPSTLYVTSDGYTTFMTSERADVVASYVFAVKAINRRFVYGFSGAATIGGEAIALVNDTTSTRFIDGIVMQRTGAAVDVVISPGAMNSNSYEGYVTSASSEGSGGFYAYQAFSEETGGGIGERWKASSTAFPQWIKIDLGVATNVVKYQVRASNAASGGPTAWVLEGSNDNSLWTLTDTVSGSTGWTLGELRTFTCDAPGSYRYWRWTISAGEAATLEIAELKLIDTLNIGLYVFFTRAAQNKIVTLNKSTGAVVQTNTTTFVSPSLVEINHVTNDLWVCHKIAGVNRITKCTFDGSGIISTTATTITGVTNPLSISISPDGATMLVVDGDTHQIKAFNTSDGSAKTAFGVSGAFGTAGGYAASPDVTNTKFMFSERALFGGGKGWVAYAPDGSFWVGDNGNYRMLHFTAGNSPTFVEHVIQMPAFYSCNVCRGAPTRVFVDYLEFAIDYSKTLSPTNGSWTLARNWSYGLGSDVAYNRLKFTGVYPNGRTYATSDVGGSRKVFELTNTGLRDTGKTIGIQAYIDTEFNLYFTHSKTAIPNCDIYKNAFAGFDASENPTWVLPADWSAAGSYPVIMSSENLPSPFTTPGDYDGTIYQSARIEELSNGIIPFFDPHGQRLDHHLGGIEAATGLMMFSVQPVNPSNHGQSISTETLFYPEAGFFAVGNGINPNGGGVFTYEPGGKDIFLCEIGEGGWGNNQVNIWHHYHETGLMVGRFGAVAPYFAAYSLVNPDSWAGDGIPSGFLSFKALSGMAGNSRWGNHALVDGVYYLYQNDEWYHSGLHRWRVEGTGNIQVIDAGSIDWDSGSYTPTTPAATDMLAGLPYNNGNLVNGTAGWTRLPTTNNTTSSGSGPWVIVSTNVLVCDTRRSPDIALNVNVNSALGAVYVYKTLPAATGDWSLEATVCLSMGVDDTASPTTHYWIAFEILDGTGKVIFTMHHFMGLANSLGDGTMVNGSLLRTREPPSTLKWPAYVGSELPVIVAANVAGATMSVTIGEFTVSRTVHEVGANLAAPARAQLKFYAASDGTTRVGSGFISRLVFNP